MITLTGTERIRLHTDPPREIDLAEYVELPESEVWDVRAELITEDGEPIHGEAA